MEAPRKYTATIVPVPIPGREYHVHIGEGASADLQPLLDGLGVARCVLLSDETVASLHLRTLNAALARSPVELIIPRGERSKSLGVLAGLYDELARHRVERGDVLLTFGGGVVGDVGGFLAATWLRGIRFLQIPTTLEAAVDASVGGKTGINHAAGKNLIGAFHQPSAVVIDTQYLRTLPRRDYVAGLAESVKHAVIRDSAFFAWHEHHAQAVRSGDTSDVVVELIGRNVAIKADVVARDEREQGLRAILNYGHTLGHAIEHELDYELRHGECVALGMIAAGEVARRRGLLAGDAAARIARLLAELGLPTHLPRPLRADDLISACRLDKKVRAGHINFMLLSDIGQVTRVEDVTDAELSAAVSVLQPS